MRERAFQLLRAVYDRVADDVQQRTDPDEAGRAAGMREEEVRAATAYLIKTGLIRHVAMDAGSPVEISVQGIAEVEDAMQEPGKATSHFPAGVSVINFGHMSGDNYAVGQAGAVGPGAHAHDMTIQQAWIQSGIDLPALAEEFARLRTAMKGEAEGSPDQDEDIGAVAAAEKAATRNDGPAALRHLKSVGKWGLGIAERVSVPVAVEATKRAMLVGA